MARDERAERAGLGAGAPRPGGAPCAEGGNMGPRAREGVGGGGGGVKEGACAAMKEACVR
jgi:hypothetical protein